MVPGVDEHLSLIAKFQTHRVSAAPVRQISVIEGRLEELVLDQHAAAGGQLLVRLRQALLEIPLSPADVILARVVGTVGQP